MLPTTPIVRAAALPLLWGVLGFVHANGASLPVACVATVLAAGVGIVLALPAAGHTGWCSLLAAVLLATSPVLQKFGGLPRELPASESLAFLKTMLVLGGLLALARLEAGEPDGSGTADDAA